MAPKRTTRLFAVCMVVTMALPAIVRAQQLNRETIARIVFQEEIFAETEPFVAQDLDSEADLETLLQGLQRDIERLRESTAEPVANGPSMDPTTSLGGGFDVPRPGSDSVLPPLREPQTDANLNPPAEKTPDTLSELRANILSRLDLFEKLKRKRLEAKQAAEQNSTATTDTGTRLEVTPTVLKATSPEPTAQQQALNTTPTAMQDPAGPTMAIGILPSTENSAVTTRPVTGPVDQFELGNSLYQTGQLKAALAAYDQVDRNAISAAEAVWLDFMIASCYRRQGNFEEATKRFRDIANQKAEPQLVQPATVWLRTLDMVSQSVSTIEQVESTIRSLQARVNENVKQ